MNSIALKVFRVAWPYLVAAIIGAALAGWVQQVRINGVKATLAVREGELKTCKGANETNVAAISSLTSERDNAVKSCDARIKLKEKTMSKIRRIDSLKPGVTGNETNSNSGGSSSADPILDGLNGMFGLERSDSKE